jgi:hypothetical protein
LDHRSSYPCSSQQRRRLEHDFSISAAADLPNPTTSFGRQSTPKRNSMARSR